jgi:hypothetical protein
VFDATPESIRKIKNFVNNLYANIIRVGDARIGLMNGKIQSVWGEFQQMAINHQWPGQDQWSAALRKVKDELRRVYAMEWNPIGILSQFE